MGISRIEFRTDPANASRPTDWAAAASFLPQAPDLNSPELNQHGKTRRDMVAELVGAGTESRADADVRRQFCEAFARRSGFALSFDGVPDCLVPLYFESRFEEWNGAPGQAEALILRADERNP
ncbi:hypothetical protein [Teichococcus vastitatis]|uniref:hypothetical protein n=1 Tax=Teichococcus vastitatis TaxID=2307076 RepID=UPI000E725228|nr:hypothetical protein [Pseudoroseomonas vastitatis]